MSTETWRWIDVNVACWRDGIDGMLAEQLMRACGPEGARIDPYEGPQVRSDVLERIQRDRWAYELDQARWAEYRDEEGSKRAEHVAEAVEKACQKFIRRDPGRRAYQSPAGDGEGRMHRGPEWNQRLRTVLQETRETVGDEYDRRHKVLTFAEWQEKFGTAP
jgi:hypothetical protein